MTSQMIVKVQSVNVSYSNPSQLELRPTVHINKEVSY